MTRPEDISQEAWDKALGVVYEIGESEEHDTLPIARAIQSAILTESERIAEWAEATADHYDAASIADVIEAVPANRAAEKALNGFATAIRSQAKENTK